MQHWGLIVFNNSWLECSSLAISAGGYLELSILEVVTSQVLVGVNVCSLLLICNQYGSHRHWVEERSELLVRHVRANECV